VLLWDGTGLCIYQKRIERGRFASLWRGDDEETFEMTLSELVLFFEGSTLIGALRLSPLPTSPQVLTSFLHENERGLTDKRHS
jgi:transposase